MVGFPKVSDTKNVGFLITLNSWWFHEPPNEWTIYSRKSATFFGNEYSPKHTCVYRRNHLKPQTVLGLTPCFVVTIFC